MSKLSVKQMMAAANAVIDTVSVHDAIGCLEEPDVAFIDVRDAAERAANGEIPGAA